MALIVLRVLTQFTGFGNLITIKLSIVVQAVLPFLPGYMWVNGALHSTGVCLAPTQHINPRTGEPCYYVKPVGWPCGAYIRIQGILDYVTTL